MNGIHAWKCGQPSQIAKDYDRPDPPIVCRRCNVAGHRVAQCILAQKVIYEGCGQARCKCADCPGIFTLEQSQESVTSEGMLIKLEWDYSKFWR